MWPKACNVKNGFYRLKKLLSEINSAHVLENNIGNAKPTISKLEVKLLDIEHKISGLYCWGGTML